MLSNLLLIFGTANVLLVSAQFTRAPQPSSSSTPPSTNLPEHANQFLSKIQWNYHGPWKTMKPLEGDITTTEASRPQPTPVTRVESTRQTFKFGPQDQVPVPQASNNGYTQAQSSQYNGPTRKVLRCRSSDGTLIAPEICKRMLTKEGSMDYLNKPIHSSYGTPPSMRASQQGPYGSLHRPMNGAEESGYQEGPDSDSGSGSPPSSSGPFGSGARFGARNPSRESSLGIKYNSHQGEDENSDDSASGRYSGDSRPPSSYGPSEGKDQEGYSRDYSEDGGRSPKSESAPPEPSNYGSEDFDPETGKGFSRYYTPSSGYDDHDMPRGGYRSSSGDVEGGSGGPGPSFRFNDDDFDDDRSYSRSGVGKSAFEDSPFEGGDMFGKEDSSFFSKSLGQETKKVADIRAQPNVTSKGKIMNPKDGATIVLGSKISVN